MLEWGLKRADEDAGTQEQRENSSHPSSSDHGHVSSVV